MAQHLRVFVSYISSEEASYRKLAIQALVGVVCLAACGQPTHHITPTPTSPLPQTVTSLHVIRTSAFPQNHIPPFEQTVNDAPKVQRLYNALLALPTPPPGLVNCPLDIGVAYHVTFFNRAAANLQATVNESGCRFAMLSNGKRLWAYSDTFWMVFADTLGVPESALFPAPQPTGPSAPTPGP
jgi:hypothetical protein